MRKYLLVLLLLLSSFAIAGDSVLERAHRTTHQIVVHSMLGAGGNCSATAVMGPHALMTASHCTGVSPKLEVDGKSYPIVGILSDGLDHSIYILKGIEFKDYADIDLRNAQAQGDDIFLFGNPGGFSDLLRKGYVTGFINADTDDQDDKLTKILNILEKKDQGKPKPAPHHQITFYDFNGFFGDSGSAIFDKNGKVIAVTSFIEGTSNGPYSIKMMGSFELKFTQEQLDQARK